MPLDSCSFSSLLWPTGQTADVEKALDRQIWRKRLSGARYSTTALWSARYLFALSPVVFVVGCYDLSLKDYTGGDGSQAVETSPGTGTGGDRGDTVNGYDATANVAGTYTLALTIQKNECGILANAVGTSSTGVTVVVTQDGSNVTAKEQGAGALGLTLITGSDTFTGKVSGNSFDLSISGTVPGSSGTCGFTRDARLDGTVTGDLLTGSVTYTYATNKTADCGIRDTCQDVQLINGTGPPTVSP
jgi:hypothetical protein